MIGGSYGGQIQFATAAVDSRVDTLVPLITWNDLRYSLAPNNTSLTAGTTYASSNPGTEKIGWTGLFFGVGIADGVTGRGHRPHAQRRLPELRPRGVPGQGDPRHAWATRPRTPTGSPTGCRSAHYLDRVHVPTFLIQGENDTLFNLQEAAATYRGAARRGASR